jgi:hypothetical protein
LVFALVVECGMAEPRKRPIVRPAVLALAGVVLLLGIVAAWLTVREPPALQQSSALKLGMPRREVEAVMGKSKTIVMPAPNETWLLYGNSGESVFQLRSFSSIWFGTSPPPFSLPEWCVRVVLDENDRVNRIERGDHIEVATSVEPAQ